MRRKVRLTVRRRIASVLSVILTAALGVVFSPLPALADSIITTTVVGAAYEASPRRQRVPGLAVGSGVAASPLSPPIRNVAGML